MKVTLDPAAKNALTQLIKQLRERYPACRPSYSQLANSLVTEQGTPYSDLALKRLSERLMPPETKRKAWLEEIARLAETASPEQLARIEKKIRKLHSSSDAAPAPDTKTQQNS